MASTTSAKTSTSLGGASNNTYSKSVISNDQSLEKQTRFTKNIVSPPLAPIGTPVNSDAQVDKRTYTTKYVYLKDSTYMKPHYFWYSFSLAFVYRSSHTGSIPVISTNGTNLVSSISFENKNILLDSVPTPLSPWGNARMSQQVLMFHSFT